MVSIEVVDAGDLCLGCDGCVDLSAEGVDCGSVRDLDLLQNRRTQRVDMGRNTVVGGTSDVQVSQLRTSCPDGVEGLARHAEVGDASFNDLDLRQGGVLAEVDGSQRDRTERQDLQRRVAGQIQRCQTLGRCAARVVHVEVRQRNVLAEVDGLDVVAGDRQDLQRRVAGNIERGELVVPHGEFGQRRVGLQIDVHQILMEHDQLLQVHESFDAGQVGDGAVLDFHETCGLLEASGDDLLGSVVQDQRCHAGCVG